jgi:PIN domain nuclease of toxin-antitoxin system
VRLLLDTRLLLWAAADSPCLSDLARGIIADPNNERYFRAASIWEIAIKTSRGRDDNRVDAFTSHNDLLDNACRELGVSRDPAIHTSGLPPIPKDPFDRILVSQASIEGLILLTFYPIVVSCLGPVRRV